MAYVLLDPRCFMAKCQQVDLLSCDSYNHIAKLDDSQFFMAQYNITGGNTLSGSIGVSSGKNSPIALICATLLTKGKVRLTGVSQVEEVLRILEVLESIGVIITWHDDETLELDTSGEIDMDTIDKEASAKTRIALLLFGAMAARQSEYKLYRSGGCHLGERTTRPHAYALEKLGIYIESKGDHYNVQTKNLVGAEIIMTESGDTATENVIMGAVLAKGRTTIKFASANYMVQDLCYFLVESGAKIQGIGTTTLVIDGVESLTPPATYAPMPDPVDAMAWISLAITTKSELTVTGCPLDFLDLELELLRVMGQKVVIEDERTSPSGHFRIADIRLPVSTLTALPDKLHPRPYPGLNIDAVPLFIPILTQAEGRTLVHDWIYENRAIYALDLQKLGAKVTLLDPHRIWVEGPTQLQGNELMCPPALRPGMALLIGMIAAKGESTLRNVYMIERGYGNLVERLKQVGVQLERSE